jgi:hypothetical protein
MIKRLLILTLSIFLLTGCTPDELEKLNGTHVELTGKVRKVGAHPFTDIAINGPNNEAIILKGYTPKQEKLLLEMMGREITLPGKLIIEHRRTADNKYTVTDYYLEIQN